MPNEAIERAARAGMDDIFIRTGQDHRLGCDVPESLIRDARIIISAYFADVPVSEEIVEVVASILAPHIKWHFASNPDCDDQNAAQDNARRLARACIKAMSAKLAEEIR